MTERLIMSQIAHDGARAGVIVRAVTESYRQRVQATSRRPMAQERVGPPLPPGRVDFPAHWT